MNKQKIMVVSTSENWGGSRESALRYGVEAAQPEHDVLQVVEIERRADKHGINSTGYDIVLLVQWREKRH